MNRRHFLALPLALPVAAAIPNPKRTETFSQPKVLSGAGTDLGCFPGSIEDKRLLRCTIGDYKMNLNGHTYTAEMWMSMFEQNHLPYCVLDDESEQLYPVPGIPMLDVAGQVVTYSINSRNVSVVMRTLCTPKGKVLRSLMQSCPMYLTPCGYGKSVIEDGVLRFEGYKFTHFAVTPTSAFECATPLHVQGIHL